ncbi:MAG: hypothetical protein JNN32_10805 [Flavobacteriales bacterium]|nr:hypothetical protein [Flavobacteriales bacterium]
MPADRGQHVAHRDHLMAYLALVGMALFAVYFAKERLYADAGYFLVRVVDEEGFHVINQRWIMPLIQWLPLVGVKAGFSLEGITVLYSLGNIVLSAGAYLYVSRVLRDRPHGLLLLATQFVGLAQALFCPVFELYYGAVLLITLRSLLHSDIRHTRSGQVMACLLFALVATCHFLGLLVLLLALTLDRIWHDRSNFIAFGSVLVVLMAQRIIGLSNYEDRAFQTVFLRLEEAGIGWVFAPGRLWAHAAQALWHYPDAILITLFAMLTAWRKKAWWPLLVFVVGHLVIYTVVSLYFPDGTHDRYRETLDYAHVLFALVAAGWAAQESHVWRKWAPYLFALVLVLRVIWSFHVGHTFAERREWIEERIANAREQRITKGLDTAVRQFVPPGFNNAPLYAPAPFEYLLLSAMQGPEKTVVLVSVPPGAQVDIQTLDAELQREGVMLPERLNGRYFHMQVGPFTVVP